MSKTSKIWAQQTVGSRRLSCGPTQTGRPEDGNGRKDGKGQRTARAEMCRRNCELNWKIIAVQTYTAL